MKNKINKNLDKNTILLNKINKWISLKWSFDKLKWTHKTTIDKLESILNDGVIWSNDEETGICFFWWISPTYWDITIIMKKEIENLEGINDDKTNYISNNIMYFFWDQNNNFKKPIKEFCNNFLDFTKYLSKENKNPNIINPYLVIWKKWSKKFNIEVWLNYIEKIIFPKHSLKYDNINNIKYLLEKNNINYEIMETSKDILDYSWISILNTFWLYQKNKINSNSYIELIKKELEEKYKTWKIFDNLDIHINHLKLEKLDENFNNNIYYNNLKQIEDWLTRWPCYWWKYNNYCNKENHEIEQKYYFKNLIDF